MSVLEGAGFALLTFVILAVSAVRRPDHARCPGDMYLHTGIRATGRFDCARTLIGPENDAVQPNGILGGRIYCNPTQPVALDYRTVECQRRFR